jgi:hypothetical protein
MCNAVIELEVLYRLPIPWTLRHHQANAEPPQPQELPPHEQVPSKERVLVSSILYSIFEHKVCISKSRFLSSLGQGTRTAA